MELCQTIVNGHGRHFHSSDNTSGQFLPTHPVASPCRCFVSYRQCMFRRTRSSCYSAILPHKQQPASLVESQPLSAAMVVVCSQQTRELRGLRGQTASFVPPVVLAEYNAWETEFSVSLGAGDRIPSDRLRSFAVPRCRPALFQALIIDVAISPRTSAFETAAVAASSG